MKTLRYVITLACIFFSSFAFSQDLQPFETPMPEHAEVVRTVKEVLSPALNKKLQAGEIRLEPTDWNKTIEMFENRHGKLSAEQKQVLLGMTKEAAWEKVLDEQLGPRLNIALKATKTLKLKDCPGAASVLEYFKKAFDAKKLENVTVAVLKTGEEVSETGMPAGGAHLASSPKEGRVFIQGVIPVRVIGLDVIGDLIMDSLFSTRHAIILPHKEYTNPGIRLEEILAHEIRHYLDSVNEPELYSKSSDTEATTPKITTEEIKKSLEEVKRTSTYERIREQCAKFIMEKGVTKDPNVARKSVDAFVEETYEDIYKRRTHYYLREVERRAFIEQLRYVKQKTGNLESSFFITKPLMGFHDDKLKEFNSNPRIEIQNGTEMFVTDFPGLPLEKRFIDEFKEAVEKR